MTHENRFGMFIHWGIYALTELHEQAFARHDIPREEYEALRLSFNPVNYDPEQWVLLAKNAGMKYICFTAKHHDGFCMWDTKHTDYSIMHTPYGKDVLRLLADACEKHGMLLSIYYSNPDWHHPAAYNPNSSHQWKSVNTDHSDFSTYREYLLAQITELLTNYGRIYTLFWDIPPHIDDPSINEYVRSLQPGILINNRGFDPGDFSTPERELSPDAALAPYTSMTEACNSIDTQSWGYRRESVFYSYRFMLSAIDRVMARGGSYLLNIGPMADGTLHPEHAARIARIGHWYNRMEGCLECHEPDAFDYQPHNSGEYIAVKKNGRTYLHFFDGIPANAVSLGAWPCLPRSVRLMNTGDFLPFREQVLSGAINFSTGIAEKKFLHIRNIPVDDLADEPIVLEIDWGE